MFAKQSSHTLGFRKKARRLLTSTLSLEAKTIMELIRGSIRAKFARVLLKLLVEVIKELIRRS